MPRHEFIQHVYGKSTTSAAVVDTAGNGVLLGEGVYMVPEWKIREIGVNGDSQGQTDSHRVLLLEKKWLMERKGCG